MMVGNFGEQDVGIIIVERDEENRGTHWLV
jgi:hypothetical protein